MSAEPDFGTDEERAAAEKQATSMQEQLSKEVASWSDGRRQPAGETVAAPSRPAAARRSPRPAAKANVPSAPAHAGTAANSPAKPFSMSYNGMTQAEYTQYLRTRGTR